MMDSQQNMPETFRLDYPLIDVQHEVLFALYHEVRLALGGEEEGFDLGDIFSGLNLYVETHLAFEENAMLATGYPQLDTHRVGHQALRDGVGGLYARFLRASEPQESRQVAGQIADFLYVWLEEHIARVDRDLCRHLKEHAFGE
ncbi:MAG: hemerythrin domain-containing protein [Magnetococcales bacterium]|nr:hemerythrin domain-containing protein [Magnetococcales bacterium]